MHLTLKNNIYFLNNVTRFLDHSIVYTGGSKESTLPHSALLNSSYKLTLGFLAGTVAV